MALKIVEKSKDFTKMELYMLTMSPEIESMKDVPDGTVIDVAGWVTFNDTSGTGEEVEILSLLDENGKSYAVQSNTFKESLMNIHEIVDGDGYSIRKISGKTKAGREYVNCVLEDLSSEADEDYLD